MRAFTAVGRRITAPVSAPERELLTRLCAELIDHLQAPYLETAFVNAHVEETEREVPENPILRYLLPKMSKDESIALELRALTEDDLRETKSKRLAGFIKLLDEAAPEQMLRLEGEQIPLVLGALTDVRLALAAPLEISSDERAEDVAACGCAALGAEALEDPAQPANPPIDPYLASLYVGLTWWQASLLEAAEGAQ